LQKIFGLILLATTPISAFADIVNDAVHIVCAPELGIFDIHIGNINGQKAYDAFTNNPDKIFEKYGWLAFENIKPDGFLSECTINDKKYAIKLTPYLGTYCKGSTFLQLRVTEDDIVLFDVPTGDCLGASCGFDDCGYQINDVTISAEEKYLVIGGTGFESKPISTIKRFRDLRVNPINKLSDIQE